MIGFATGIKVTLMTTYLIHWLLPLVMMREMVSKVEPL